MSTSVVTKPAPIEVEEQELHRGLANRHIQMMAIGGAIGVGLFLGSANAIRGTGPSLVLDYLLVGVMVFLVLRALGEMAVHRPIAGSFTAYAAEYVGPWASFSTGWTYWFSWIMAAVSELTATGIYVKYWVPGMPQWLTVLLAAGVLFSLNMIAVSSFGEAEFWFALIKIVAIVALIVGGLAMVIFSAGPLGHAASFTNLWSHGGVFPKGISAALLALPIVFFAFGGVELIGVTAGEAKDPGKTLPSAINKVVVRILLFYVGSLIVIMSLMAWNKIGVDRSPFVTVFDGIGLPAAAGLLNAVVLTAALSACNSGVFTTSRILYSMAKSRQAPSALGRVNKRKVPAIAVCASVAVMLVGVVVNYLVPQQAFIYLASVATLGMFWAWGMIMICNLRFRRKMREDGQPTPKFRLPGAPYTNWLVLAFLATIAVMLGLNSETRIAAYIAPFWFGLLGIGYYFYRRRVLVDPTTSS